MRLKRNSSDEIMTVYGIYNSNKGAIFCVSPKNYNGLIALKSNEVVIIDNVIDREFKYFEFESGSFGIFDKYIVDGRILDELFELNPEVCEKFKEYIDK